MVFPSNDSVIRQPLCSGGSLGLVPRPPSSYGLLRIPDTHPASLLLFARRYRPVLSYSLPRVVSTPPVGLGSFNVVSLTTCVVGGSIWASQVPGGPPACMPCSWTPADRMHQAIPAHPILPSVRSKTSAPRLVTFEARSHGLRDSLSTLRSPGHPGSTQDSVPAAGWAWPGGLPAGSQCEVSGCLCHPSPPPKLRLAQ